MKGAARSSDITIPKGVVICYPITDSVVDTDGGIDIGYCQEAEMSIAETTRQVYSARTSAKALAVDKVTKTEYSLPLQVMSINADNLAMLFRGVKGNIIQVAGAYDAAALSITAPAALDRAQKLTRRHVSITRIDFESGSAAFTAGSELSTGTATATIVWVTGTVSAGSLYVARVVDGSSEFIDGAALVDDNGSPGGGSQSGAITIEEDIVLTDGSTTRYTKDTDYGLDPKSGTVFYLSTGTITAAQASMEAFFDYEGITEVVIHAGETGITNYQVEVLPFSDSTENNIESVFWQCSVKADSTLKLITAGEEEVLMDITFTPLTDGPNATSSDPVFRQIVM